MLLSSLKGMLSGIRDEVKGKNVSAAGYVSDHILLSSVFLSKQGMFYQAWSWLPSVWEQAFINDIKLVLWQVTLGSGSPMVQWKSLIAKRISSSSLKENMLQLRILRISFCSVRLLMRYVHSCPVETSLILKIVQLALVFSILIIPIIERNLYRY